LLNLIILKAFDKTFLKYRFKMNSSKRYKSKKFKFLISSSKIKSKENLMIRLDKGRLVLCSVKSFIKLRSCEKFLFLNLLYFNIILIEGRFEILKEILGLK
jgi:hypothetical protein